MNDPRFRPSRRAAISMIGGAMLLPGSSLANAPEAMSGAAFGTSWRVSGNSGAGFERVRKDISELFDTVDRQMSPWRSHSTVSRFNFASAGWHSAEEEVCFVTKNALDLARESGGSFDPTVGPLVGKWGFGPIEGGGTPDWRGLLVGSHGIAKTRDDLTLDLCGIAKGWALDRAVSLVRAAGFRNFLFDLGGELKALGRHPSGRPWQIAVQHPFPGKAPPAVLRLPSGWAVATSGLRNQSYTLGDRIYGHIINPIAQFPAGGKLQSVTVVSQEAMTADGWATALFAAGLAAGPGLARRRGIAALFLFREEAGIQQITTGAIEDMLL